MELVDRARLYIAKMPPAISGSGGHDRTYAVAAVLVHGFALDHDNALSLLREWNQTHCEPKWTDHELIHKIETVRPAAGKPRGHLRNKAEKATLPPPKAGKLSTVHYVPKWPEKNHGAILGFLEGDFFNLNDLEAMSPVAVKTLRNPNDVVDIVDCLFRSPDNPDPLLCLAKSPKAAATLRFSEWEGNMEGQSLIVPSRMTASTGKKQDGKDSVRCLGNTGSRDYLVIECDFDPAKDAPLFARLEESGRTLADLCAAVAGQLSEYAPLTLACHSGSKSLHSWFKADGIPEIKLRSFMEYAVSLGADKATWTRCQLVRLPAGIRDNGNRQTVHFFDPKQTLSSHRLNPINSFNY